MIQSAEALNRAHSSPPEAEDSAVQLASCWRYFAHVRSDKYAGAMASAFPKKLRSSNMPRAVGSKPPTGREEVGADHRVAGGGSLGAVFQKELEQDRRLVARVRFEAEPVVVVCRGADWLCHSCQIKVRP